MLENIWCLSFCTQFTLHSKYMYVYVEYIHMYIHIYVYIISGSIHWPENLRFLFSL